MGPVIGIILLALAGIGAFALLGAVVDADIGDGIAAAWLWVTRPFVHRHDGPQFKATGKYGGAIEGAPPQIVTAWHTCKKCERTYAVERYETVDEFEARQKPDATTSGSK